MCLRRSNFLAAWRSTRVLDDRKVGSVAREEAVVHALLRDRAAAPLEPAPEGLRRAIASRIEGATPAPFPSRWAVSPRLLSWSVPVLVLAVGGASLLQLRAQTTPTAVPPSVARPFTHIVGVRIDESGAASGFPADAIDEGLLTAGPLSSPRRPVPAWMRELPGAAPLAKRDVDPLVMEARQFEFTTRTAAQALIANQIQAQQGRRREE